MLINKYLMEISDLTDKDIYLVGGAVRSYILGNDINNIDIVVQDDGIRLAKKFVENRRGTFVPISEEYGIGRTIIKNNENDKKTIIDFCTIKGRDIYEDLSNRDFTMNAMAIKINKREVNFNEIIDPFNGIDDIKKGIIRETNDKVFENDPIRMLRAVRFMAQFGFDMTDTSYELINKNSERIKEVSGQRISDELFKILGFKRAHYYFNLMDKQLNILNKIFPEIEPMKEVGKCKYHVVDAWTHSLHTMRVIEKIIYANGYFEKHLRKAYEQHTAEVYSNGHTRIQLIKLAALFHDIGKPGARWVDETGRVRFRGHEIVGEEIMANVSDRLKLSNREKKFLCKIVKEHMWPLTLYKTNDVSGKALYDLFKNFGDITLDIILIGLADIISTRQLLNPDEEMGMYKVHAEYLANNYLTRFKRLQDISDTINGKDILENFNIEDKRVIGEILDSVKRAIFFGQIPLERDRILKYIEEYLL